MVHGSETIRVHGDGFRYLRHLSWMPLWTPRGLCSMILRPSTSWSGTCGRLCCPATSSATDSWDDAKAAVDKAIPLDKIKWESLTVRDLKATLKRTHARSATGADAWAMDELRSMPEWLLQRLAEALTSFEEGYQVWSQEVLSAWVALTPKAEASSFPNEMRPIVLLAMTIRLWTSTRGRKILVQPADIAPRNLRGDLSSKKPQT